jgi:hypothetical protein
VVQSYYSQDSAGFVDDESLVALKALAHRGPRFAAAVQAGVTWRSEPDPECTPTGGEVRMMAGMSSRGGGQFGNVEAAYREAGGCAHARYEVTWGVRPRRDWLLLGQVFADDDLRFAETVKVQATAVRFTRKGRGLQLGVRLRVDGVDVIEPTIIVGYWSAARQ